MSQDLTALAVPTAPAEPGLVDAVRALTTAVQALTAAIESRGFLSPASVVAAGTVATALAAAPAAPRPALSHVSTPTSAESPIEAGRRLVTALFDVAAAPEGDEAAFEAFLALNHTERTSAPRAVPSLREFAWRQLRKRRHEYLSNPTDSTSFTVARSDPTTVDAKALSFRLFLQSSGRSPTPVTFKRDPAAEGAYRVTDSSL